MFAYLILRVHVSIQFLLCNFMRDIPTQLTVFFMTVDVVVCVVISSKHLKYLSESKLYFLAELLSIQTTESMFILALDQKDKANNNTQSVFITHKVHNTYTVYEQSTTVSVHLSELGPPTPSPASHSVPIPEPKEGRNIVACG